jgi:glycosyltransferase involved in cell wall biosynthesis
MRLLYLHHVPLTTQSANIIQVLHMCQTFQSLGVDVVLSVPWVAGRTDCEMRDLIENELGEPIKFTVRSYPQYTIRGRFATLGCYWGVREILQSTGNVDVCFVRNPFLARLALRSGMKTVYESHDERLHPTSSFMNMLYMKMLLADVQSPGLVQFIAISGALADIWRKRGVPARKILVLHDGVSSHHYQSAKSLLEARSALGIRTDTKLVVYAGSLYEDRQIEVVLRLARVFSNVTFMVIGGPDHQKEWYDSIVRREALGNVVFVGRVPHQHVREYLFAADVLLMLWSSEVPTIHVCSPLKVFEYMASGRVIVGHAFPTITEVLVDGETAFLATPANEKELEKKLATALSLTYPNLLAQKAREIALTQYSWEARASRILEGFGGETMQAVSQS